MTAEPIAATPLDMDQDRSYVVRTERNGKVWCVTVPLTLAEAKAHKQDSEDRRTARLKKSNDAWDHVPQRYFICRIQYEEV